MSTTDRNLAVVLISTYDLGHQPFGLASPARWLRDAGATVDCLDLAVEEFDVSRILGADIVAFHVPMHTASRLAVPVARQVHDLNPDAHLCFYGLYAPVNEGFFRGLGAGTVLGGEFEEGLVKLYRRLQNARGGQAGPQREPVISLQRLDFRVPDRAGLPALDRYAHLSVGAERRVIGYTETTRGCKHTCRHCPIVPVYGGRFRAVQREVVLGDIRRQVQAGAQHVSFGDPDFLNAPGHTLPIVTALHEEFPTLTYDVIIKVQHLVRYAQHIPTLKATGCVLVTTAVEAVDDTILDRLDKHHTRADLEAVVASFRAADLALSPTFVAFTPWTTLAGYVDLLDTVADLGLVELVAPVQYSIRLLIPAGSRLFELDEVRDLVDEFDSEALVYPWRHTDPAVDALQREVADVVAGADTETDRSSIFAAIRELAYRRAGRSADPRPPAPSAAHGPIPQVSEPWYCCAEPTGEQFCAMAPQRTLLRLDPI
jgi:radical SAM superfamily enzyme YgiQ (UPF0313 family)